MTKIGALAGLALLGVALWWLLQRGRASESSSRPAATAATGSAAAPAGSAAAPGAKPVDKVGKVTPEERDRLADRIANARAGRTTGGAATSGRAVPTLPGADSDATLVRTTMKQAMREVVPFLAECYDKAGSAVPAELKVTVDMTLTGDPDVGTIIDTNGVASADGQPLPPAFDLCLRDALASLQMPPLSEGGEVEVTYPFLFSR